MDKKLPPPTKESISLLSYDQEQDVNNYIIPHSGNNNNNNRIELASAQGAVERNTSWAEDNNNNNNNNNNIATKEAARKPSGSPSLPGAFSVTPSQQTNSVVSAKSQASYGNGNGNGNGGSLQLAAATEGEPALPSNFSSSSSSSQQQRSSVPNIPPAVQFNGSRVVSNEENPEKNTSTIQYPNEYVVIQQGAASADNDDVEHGQIPTTEKERSSMSEIFDKSIEIEKSQEFFRMSRTPSGMEVPTLEAIKVDSEANLGIMATAEKDSCWAFFKRSRCAQLSTFFGSFIVVALLVGLLLAFFNKSIVEVPYDEEFFDQIGPSLDGPVIRGQHGSSISLSRDGTRMAVADSKDVYLYDLQEEKASNNGGGTTTFDWQLVATIEAPEHATLGEETHRHDMVRTAVQVDLSKDGDFIAVGWPYSGNEEGFEPSVGRVEVYQDKGNGVWERLGNVMYGWSSEDFFGTSVSLSGSGGTVVVGAPGNEGHADIFLLNQGVWVKQGDFVSLEGTLAVGSVSSDETGQTFSVAGNPNSGDPNAAVVRIFRFTAGNWAEMGSGIIGDFKDTAYITALSADGTIVAVSNYYRGAAGPAKGELNDALDVRVFRWDDDKDDWVQLGENLHGSAPGEKSGYFISLSDDGTLMGMGDPGRESLDGGGVAGHAHIYQYNEQSGVWEQRGPNKDGEAPGDQFGFAVALSGDGTRFAVGAPFNRGEGIERGRVTAYDIDL